MLMTSELTGQTYLTQWVVYLWLTWQDIKQVTCHLKVKQKQRKDVM